MSRRDKTTTRYKVIDGANRILKFIRFTKSRQRDEFGNKGKIKIFSKYENKRVEAELKKT